MTNPPDTSARPGTLSAARSAPTGTPPSTALTVVNPTRTLQVVNLERGVDYGHPDLAPTRITLEQAVEGGVEITERELPGSVTWLPGERRSGLPARLAEAPAFRDLVRAGKLRIETP